MFASRPCTYLDWDATSFFSTEAIQSGVSTILETGNPHLQSDSNASRPLTQNPEDNGVCCYDVFLRALGGTVDASSTPAVVPAAQASNDANRGNCTLKEIQEFCANSVIAMKHTTRVTPQWKGVSARYGQNVAIQKECTPTGGNNTPEKAPIMETERQYARIPDITPEEATVTETERFRALVQVMLHYYENNLLEEESHRQQPERHRRELEHPHETISVIITRDWRIVIKGWSTCW